MADSDIQFLGNWNSQQGSADTAFVSAIVLTASDGTPPRTFSRTQTTRIHVGRIPAQDAFYNNEQSSAEESARYTNPVMSRNHAKITFADSGTVYIIDTGSHHGTWVCRLSSSTPSTKLTPESPCMLLDGDNIIFGKEVTKNGIKHQPLSIRVKLLRTGASNISSFPDKVASPKPRKRFGLGSSADSDSSDNEGGNDKPCLSHVELISGVPLMGTPKSSDLGHGMIGIDSASSESSSSTSSSPSSIQNFSTTPQHPYMPNHINSTGTSSFLLSPSRYSPGPSLQLSGIGNRQDNTIPLPGIQSVAPSTPPWRRASALFSAGGVLDSVTGQARPQRRIGRLFNPFNPLWMRSLRTGSEIVGPANNIPGGLREEATSEDHHERHEEFHGRHGHHRHHSLDWSLRSNHHEVDLMEAMDDEPAVQDRKEDGMSARFDDLRQQLAAAQDAIRALRPDGLFEELPTLKATIASLETALNVLREDLATVQADVSAGSVDNGVLRVDLATLRTGYSTDIAMVQESTRTQATDLRLLRSDINAMRNDVSGVETVAGEVGELRTAQDGICGEVRRLRGELTALQGIVEGVVAAAGKISKDLQNSEETIMRKVREEIMRSSRDREAESLPLEGKRKRRHDEAFSSDSGPSTDTIVSAPTEPRPSKRLRTVADFAAASVIGAFGAYVGLAYLQL